jgi:hypothetical protein
VQLAEKFHLSRLSDEDRDLPSGSLLIILVRRICLDGDGPQPGSFAGVHYFPDTHGPGVMPVADLDKRISAEIVDPDGILGRAAHRTHEDVVVAILNSH